MTPPIGLGRIGRHTLIYGAGMLLGRAVGFVMLPVYTRYLTPADYGTLQLITMVLEVMSIVAGSRLGAGIFYFFQKADTEADKRSVLSTAALVLAASYGCVAVGTYLAAPSIAVLVFRSAADTPLVRIAAGGLASDSLLLVPLAFLQARERSTTYVAVTFAKLVIQVGLNILFLVGMRLGVAGVLWGSLISSAVVGTALTIHLFLRVGARVSARTMRDLLRFGLPFVATQVATFILTFGDRYFLNRAGDVAVVGLYGLAYQFGFLLGALAYVPFNSVWEPVRFAIARRADRDAVYARVHLYFNVLLVALTLVIALFVEDFLTIAAAPAFRPAASLVPIILVAYLLQAWTGFHNLGVQMVERTEYITIANWIGAGVALAGYVTLIPRWLGLGAAVATAVSFAVREALVYWYSQRLWPIRYEWRPVIRLLCIGTVVWGAATRLAPSQGIALSLAWHTTWLLVFGAGVWFGGVLPAPDRHRISEAVRSPRAGVAGLWAAIAR
jgi:O-antigen/teichoic acid export membrane protein